MRTTLSALLAPLCLAAALVCAPQAHAAGFEKGPVPTAAALNVAGPYAVGSHKIAVSAAKPYAYGGATVHYPQGQAGETFGIVAMMPGFMAFQAVYDGLVKKMASHGFIVINIDSVGRGDLPDVRAKAVAGALKHVSELVRAGQVPYATLADTSRQAIVGNSMGGGAVLTAAEADPALKAVVALQPWHTTQAFPKVASPTLIVACQKDTIAPNNVHSDVFYASLPDALPRGEIEVKGASHLCATFLASKAQLNTMNKATVSWLKRFLDEDMRYDAMVKGGINEGEFSRFVVEGF